LQGSCKLHGRSCRFALPFIRTCIETSHVPVNRLNAYSVPLSSSYRQSGKQLTCTDEACSNFVMRHDSRHVTALLSNCHRIIYAVWNSLPASVIGSDSLSVFKSRLKTFLFRKFRNYSKYNRRFTNMFIIIIITFHQGDHLVVKKLT